MTGPMFEKKEVNVRCPYCRHINHIVYVISDGYDYHKCSFCKEIFYLKKEIKIKAVIKLVK
jgi:hypothetical protein